MKIMLGNQKASRKKKIYMQNITANSKYHRPCSFPELASILCSQVAEMEVAATSILCSQVAAMKLGNIFPINMYYVDSNCYLGVWESILKSKIIYW